jgi:hypothetical protein
MLKLLRLPFFHSLRVENSRNPACGRRYADFSDALHSCGIAPCSLHVAPSRSTGKVCAPALSAFVFQPQRRRAARSRPQQAEETCAQT